MCGTSIFNSNDCLLGTKWLTWLPWWFSWSAPEANNFNFWSASEGDGHNSGVLVANDVNEHDSSVLFHIIYIAMIATLANSFMFKNTYVMGAISRSKNKSRLRWSKDLEWNKRFVVTYLGSLLASQVEFSSSLHPRFPWNPLGDLEFFMARWAMLAMWWPAKQLKKLLQLQRKHGRKFNLDWRPVAL